MKTAAIINEICSLPRKQRIFIAEKILHSIRKEENSSEKEKKPLPKNPNNPSPSGDPWFDDPRNLAMLDERIREMKEGKSKLISLDDDEELQAIFAWARQ